MTAKVIETEVPEGDLRSEVLATAVGHDLWVLISATIDEDDGLNLKLETGGLVRGYETIRNLLKKTLEALPDD